MLQVLVVSTAHLAWRQAMSARSPIHAASADYVFARRDTSAVTTCVVRLSSLNTSEWITELITNSSGMICSVGGSQGLRSATPQKRTHQNSSRAPQGLFKHFSWTFRTLQVLFKNSSGLFRDSSMKDSPGLLKNSSGLFKSPFLITKMFMCNTYTSLYDKFESFMKFSKRITNDGAVMLLILMLIWCVRSSEAGAERSVFHTRHLRRRLRSVYTRRLRMRRRKSGGEWDLLWVMSSSSRWFEWLASSAVTLSTLI